MSSGQIYFNCGEFRPGQEPLSIPGINPPVSPSYTPIQPREEVPFIIVTPIKIPPTRPPFTPFEVPKVPGTFTPFTPQQPTGQQPSSTGVGSIPGSRPAGQPGGGITGVGIPITGEISKWRCSHVNYYCPQDLELPENERRIMRIIRFCVMCNLIRDPETGVYVYENDCSYNSLAECEQVCQDSGILNDCIDPTTTTTVFQTANRLQQVEIPTGTIAFQPGIEVNPTVQITTILEEVPTTTISIGQLALENRNVTVSSESGTPVLYDPHLNFFRVTPTITTTLVPNNRYPNIFGETVASDVSYLLGMVSSQGSWSEHPIQNLTLEKLAISLNPTLLNAFNRIHHQGGIQVGLNPFLSMVKKHLVTGTLEEIDTNHYIELAQRQIGDRIIQYESSQVREYLERAALGVISYNSISVDSEKFGSIQTRQIRRQRRLNTDIDARIRVCPIDSESDGIVLDNTGFCLRDLNDNQYTMNTGDGDGYYLPVQNRDGGCFPFNLATTVSSAYYVPADVRFNALTIMGEDPSITIRVRSLISLEPQGDQFLASIEDIEFSPMYFSLNLVSVSSLNTTNPLIDRTQATYSRIIESSSIEAHLDNNGFAVTRFNIDFRDPIFRHIFETSSFTLEQNDITFRAFDQNRAIIDQAVLTRNIPFGVVITPVLGSKYNPFSGFSRLEEFSNTNVRLLQLTPSINYSDKDQRKSELQEINLYDNSGEFKIGVKEPNDLQNVTYRFATSAENLINTNYSNGSYVSGFPSLSGLYGAEYLVNKIDQLIVDYDPDEIIWFDVFRRMTLNKFGEIMYDGSQALINSLSKGARSGIPIKNVLNRLQNKDSLILEDDTDVIIRRNDRSYAKNY